MVDPDRSLRRGVVGKNRTVLEGTLEATKFVLLLFVLYTVFGLLLMLWLLLTIDTRV